LAGTECLVGEGGCAAEPGTNLNKLPGGKVTASGNVLTVTGEKYKITYTFTDQNGNIKTESDAAKYNIRLTPTAFARRPDLSWHAAAMAMDCFDRFAFFPGGSRNLLVEGITVNWWSWTYGTDITLTPRVNTPADTEGYNTAAKVPCKELTVYSPTEYRVFQRDRAYQTVVRFAGKTEGDKVKIRLWGKSLKGEFDVGDEIEADKSTGAFNGSLRADAGGWYKASIRACKGGKLIKEKIINHVGVGEVFIGAGQSNSTNCGQFQIKSETGMVVCFDGEKWQPGSSPFTGTHDDSVAGCYYPAFGDALYRKYKVPVAVASTGHGGSSIEQWQPDVVPGEGYPAPEQGSMYSFMLKRMEQLGKGGFRGVLWHQGESNAGSPVDVEYNNMVTLIESSKKDAGWDFPWFVAKVSYHNPEHPSWPNIREVHSRLWANGIAEKGPDTDTLTGDMRDYEGKGIHFSPKGLKKHGEMWANAVSRYLDKVL
ncbi:MAG: hypothetical protein J6X53_00180, partial [Abditibacteriota bacterium]|nr:hypothetical protein [Abditibacteriota bacterium]